MNYSRYAQISPYPSWMMLMKQLDRITAFCRKPFRRSNHWSRLGGGRKINCRRARQNGSPVWASLGTSRVWFLGTGVTHKHYLDSGHRTDSPGCKHASILMAGHSTQPTTRVVPAIKYLGHLVLLFLRRLLRKSDDCIPNNGPNLASKSRATSIISFLKTKACGTRRPFQYNARVKAQVCVGPWGNIGLTLSGYGCTTTKYSGSPSGGRGVLGRFGIVKALNQELANWGEWEEMC